MEYLQSLAQGIRLQFNDLIIGALIWYYGDDSNRDNIATETFDAYSDGFRINGFGGTPGTAIYFIKNGVKLYYQHRKK